MNYGEQHVVCWNRECEGTWLNKKGEVILREDYNRPEGSPCPKCGEPLSRKAVR